MLDHLYDAHREVFFQWAGKRFRCERAVLEDAWQDTVIVFYGAVKSGRLTTLNCSVKTYLFAVGFRVLSANERKSKRFALKDEIDYALDGGLAASEPDDPWLAERKTLLAAMGQLSPACRQMLKLRYYEEKSLSEVQVELGYNSQNSLNASMSRCLKRLKEIIRE